MLLPFLLLLSLSYFSREQRRQRESAARHRRKKESGEGRFLLSLGFFSLFSRPPTSQIRNRNLSQKKGKNMAPSRKSPFSSNKRPRLLHPPVLLAACVCAAFFLTSSGAFRCLEGERKERKASELFFFFPFGQNLEGRRKDWRFLQEQAHTQKKAGSLSRCCR